MNFAAIVVFAIAMGVATSKVVSRMVNKTQLNENNPDLTFVDLLVELDRILGVMIIWVIMLTPFAVCSMIISAIGEEEDLATLFKMVGLLMACTWMAFIIQYLGVYCALYTLLLRKNPFIYTAHLLPCQIMGKILCVYIFMLFKNSKLNMPFSHIVVYRLLFFLPLHPFSYSFTLV
jgi:hypothetical protein